MLDDEAQYESSYGLMIMETVGLVFRSEIARSSEAVVALGERYEAIRHLGEESLAASLSLMKALRRAPPEDWSLFGARHDGDMPLLERCSRFQGAVTAVQEVAMNALVERYKTNSEVIEEARAYLGTDPSDGMEGRLVMLAARRRANDIKRKVDEPQHEPYDYRWWLEQSP